jgi:uncharacterized RDD family membrane protein YckC
MQTIEIQTTQNVNIEYPIASVGERIVASIIDFLIMIGYFIAIFFLFYLAVRCNRWDRFVFPSSLWCYFLFANILLSSAL